MSEKVKITVFCCNYTNLVDEEDLRLNSAEIKMIKYPCSGHIEIVEILKALREGSEGVLVIGCEKGTCHNKNGNERAEKRVLEVRKILKEIDINPEIVKMSFVSRLDSGQFLKEIENFCQQILHLRNLGRD